MAIRDALKGIVKTYSYHDFLNGEIIYHPAYEYEIEHKLEEYCRVNLDGGVPAWCTNHPYGEVLNNKVEVAYYGVFKKYV